MSRMRQIPVMDISQQEKAISQTCYHSAMRPIAHNCRMRPKRATTSKFRLSDTPALISSGCSSVRTFCNNIQSITVDLNNLIGSVESMLPLLTTYLTALQARSMPTEQSAMVEPPIDVTATDSKQSAVHPTNLPPDIEKPMAAPAMASSMPRPEDIQQLLENPLVKNLLTSFLQNTPHT